MPVILTLGIWGQVVHKLEFSLGYKMRSLSSKAVRNNHNNNKRWNAKLLIWCWKEFQADMLKNHCSSKKWNIKINIINFILIKKIGLWVIWFRYGKKNSQTSFQVFLSYVLGKEKFQLHSEHPWGKMKE